MKEDIHNYGITNAFSHDMVLTHIMPNWLMAQKYLQDKVKKQVWEGT